MRNIETFPSKHMYLYLSLVERKVAVFYHNINRRRYLVWLKWLICITFSRQLPVSLWGLRHPHPRPGLALFWSCKQTIIQGDFFNWPPPENVPGLAPPQKCPTGPPYFVYCKYLVCRSITCSARLPQYSYQTRQSRSVSSWACRAAPVLPSGSDFLRVLE